ncbi:Ribosomal protein S7, mitochondrial [Tetrabaena socialis]|uniref:Ribosomal protein S7, mitochondrial n=1 Tax=Tetrabaena socialis TaxID=47790 RepID=A0A2J8A650_9CHLO|nr:Ribosomal protein S7, mitochondrial [Tetrabaena socialis]|eukprot:PNH08004.1 Ribosomal protein S7, mitochondrial [Tetrabaena socialis]
MGVTPLDAACQVQQLAEKLRKASPTGLLRDLFAPSEEDQPRRGRSQTPGGPPPASSAAAAAAAASSSAAAAAAAAAEAAALSDADVVRMVVRAVENCKPLMKVQQSKSGTKVVYMPKPLSPDQSRNFSIKWILQAAAKRQEGARGGATMAECLALELLLAYQRKGAARTRRDEIHKLALDNRANLRTKWW